MHYQHYLQTDYWRAVSAKVKERAGYKCQVCNSPRSLVAHHRTYAHRFNEMEHLDDLVCLCSTCHEQFHKPQEIDGRVRATVMPDTYRSPMPPKKQVHGPRPPKMGISRRERRRIKLEKRAEKRRAKIAAMEEHKNAASSWRAELEQRWQQVASLYNHEADMPPQRPIIVTKLLFRKMQTAAGGHTSKTLKALGVPFPLVSGWSKAIIGKEITENQCRAAFVGRECLHTLKTLSRKP